MDKSKNIALIFRENLAIGGMLLLKLLLATVITLIVGSRSFAQVSVDLTDFNKDGETAVSVSENVLDVTWPAGSYEQGKLTIDLQKDTPFFSSIQLRNGGKFAEIATNLDPVFILTEGQRNLNRDSGWNIFFDRTAYLPYEEYIVNLVKQDVKVLTEGSRTKIRVSELKAGIFSGNLVITVYNGSPLMKTEAVMRTEKDSTAIIYDAGLVSGSPDKSAWDEVFWADTKDHIRSANVDAGDESKNLEVKYRTVIGESEGGSVAVFPPPHQYFYPLDNAFNLNFTWYGSNYRNLVPGYGIGIRHDLMGDMRYVPWFNAPPNTGQRLSFFTLLSTEKDGQVLEEVKEFTNGDSYRPLPGHKTMASHFHTEHITDIINHRPLPDIPGHVRVMRDLGVNIMHQGEFHLSGNPRDPGPRRLEQLRMMHEEFKALSDGNFLMLPGEEPNVHFGGHWMIFFPEPVYWHMNRGENQPFVEEHTEYGKVYRVANQEEMLRLLKEENALAWTAHPRTKGSTGYPDKYKDENFYESDHFLGAAWKSLPADLSKDKMGVRALDLMNDMANWGDRKYMLGEADLFKLEPDFEVYGHMNINYLRLDELPDYEDGWESILETVEQGKFFVTTGEVLLPEFTVNGKQSGDQLSLNGDGEAEITLGINWTFPLDYAEIISGDGEQVYRKRIPLTDTEAFGEDTLNITTQLGGRDWVRVEVWDTAVNGAFTQFVWLN